MQFGSFAALIRISNCHVVANILLTANDRHMCHLYTHITHWAFRSLMILKVPSLQIDFCQALSPPTASQGPFTQYLVVGERCFPPATRDWSIRTLMRLVVLLLRWFEPEDTTAILTLDLAVRTELGSVHLSILSHQSRNTTPIHARNQSMRARCSMAPHNRKCNLKSTANWARYAPLWALSLVRFKVCHWADETA